MRYIILIIFILFTLATPVFGSYNCTTLQNDGSDNTSALTSCLASAELESDKTCNIPSASGGEFQFDSDVTIPGGVTVQCAASFASIFDPVGEFQPSDGSAIIECYFKSRARVIETPEDGTKITGVHIIGNKFEGSSGEATILMRHADSWVVTDNIFTDSGNDFQNIRLTAGTGNFFIGNQITGGKTCIILIWSYSLNPSTKGLFNNVVMGNTCADLSEEGISADMAAGSGDSVPTRETDTVSAISSNVITLSHADWGAGGGADPDYTDFYLVWVIDDDGEEMATHTYKKITGQSGADITIESAITGLEVGDTVSITAIAENNYFAFNHMSGAGFIRSNLIFYGPVYNSRIEENNPTKGIAVRALVNLPAATGGVTDNTCGAISPSANVVRGNDVNEVDPGDTCADNVNYCDIQFTISSGGGGCGDGYHLTYDNVIVDNDLGDDILLYYHSYYQNGNTYDELNNIGSTSVDAGSTSLDVTDWTCEEYGLSCVIDNSNVIGAVSDLDDTCSGALVCAVSGDDSEPSSGTRGIQISEYTY